MIETIVGSSGIAIIGIIFLCYKKMPTIIYKLKKFKIMRKLKNIDREDIELVILELDKLLNKVKIEDKAYDKVYSVDKLLKKKDEILKKSTGMTMEELNLELKL